MQAYDVTAEINPLAFRSSNTPNLEVVKNRFEM